MNSDHETVKDAILKLFVPIEEFSSKELLKVKAQQAELNSQIESLLAAYEKVAEALPQSDLQTTTEKVNHICERIENCHVRISQLSKRSDRILTFLESLSPKKEQA